MQEDAVLIDLVQKYGEKRWNMVANGLPGRTGKGCSHRCAHCTDAAPLRSCWCLPVAKCTARTHYDVLTAAAAPPAPDMHIVTATTLTPTTASQQRPTGTGSNWVNAAMRKMCLDNGPFFYAPSSIPSTMLTVLCWCQPTWLYRWRTYLRPDVKHPHLEPFTEWEAAVIVQAQREMGNNWLGKSKQSAAIDAKGSVLTRSCLRADINVIVTA